MPVIRSELNTQSEDFRRNAEVNRALAADLRALAARIAEGGSAEARERHRSRGKLLARERIDRLLDIASPFLEIGQLAGHELGNHSIFHPCPRAMLPDRKNYFTDDYDVDRMLGEIAVQNNILFGIDGRKSRTYSVPCSQMLFGGVDYTNALRKSGLVKYVRTGGDAFNSVIADPRKLNRFQIPSYGPVDHPDGKTLIAYAERVRSAKGLGVLQFHGTGGDYLEVTADAHRALVDWLRNHPEVWVAPFQDVMDYASAHSR